MISYSGKSCIPLQRLCSISSTYPRCRVRLLQLPRVFRQEQLCWHRFHDPGGRTNTHRIIEHVTHTKHRSRSSVRTPTLSSLPTLRRDPGSWLPSPPLPPSSYSQYHTSTSLHTTRSLYMSLYSQRALQITPKSPLSGNAASPSFNLSHYKSLRT
jgi:hypothetical protein